MPSLSAHTNRMLIACQVCLYAVCQLGERDQHLVQRHIGIALSIAPNHPGSATLASATSVTLGVVRSL